MTVLVIAELEQGSLLSATYHALGAARQFGSDIEVLVAGQACTRAAEEVARLAGVSRVWLCQADHYADQGAENLAELLRALLAGCTRYSHVVVTAGSFGKGLLPRLAALLDVAPLTDVVAIEAADTFVRPTYAGAALVRHKSHDRLRLLAVRATAFTAVVQRHGLDPAPVDTLPPRPDLGLSRVVCRAVPDRTRPTLTDARVVVAGGRGLGSAEQFQRLLEPLAGKLNAAIGASRAAVDAGFIGNEHQVGQSGKVVAPALYLAIGISGAVQHLAGMRDSEVIVAINKDAEAPIFAVADYGLVGDLFKLVPELMAAL